MITVALVMLLALIALAAQHAYWARLAERMVAASDKRWQAAYDRDMEGWADLHERSVARRAELEAELARSLPPAPLGDLEWARVKRAVGL